MREHKIHAKELSNNLKKIKDMLESLEKEKNSTNNIDHVQEFISKCQSFYEKASEKILELEDQALLKCEEKQHALCSFFAEDYNTFKVRFHLMILLHL